VEPSQLGCVVVLQMLSIEGDQLALYGESDERFRIRGGNALLPAALAQKLHSSTVALETSLVGLRLDGGRFALSLESQGTTREEQAERVVLALPFSVLRSVTLDSSLALPDTKKLAIEQLGYGTNAKLLLGFRDRPWAAQGRSGEVFTDLPIQSAWDATRAQPASKAGVLTLFTGGDRGTMLGSGTTAERASEAMPHVDKLFPQASASAGPSARAHWPSHPRVKGSYSTYLTGQLTRFGGAEGEAVGALHFAGEHTSVRAQGYLEGAVESGERAAAEVLAALGAKPH